ncbi:MAG: fused signal recognition particle receptor [Natronomonas sp.]|jgi:fused signal recognition particle receptor
MFDGLKDKFTDFTEDVEEDAETVTAPEDGDEGGGEADTEPATEAPSEREPEPEPAPAEPAEPAAANTGDEAPEADDRAGQAEDADTEPPGGAVDDTTEPDGDRGLTERAKLLATGKTVIDEDDLQAHLDDLEFALLRSDVEMEVAQEILDGVEENLVGQTRRRLSSTGNRVQDALREALYDVISVGQFDFDSYLGAADKPVVIVFTGVNGVGKTTTIAKLAHYLEERSFSSVLANGDTYRAGADEQLQEHADALGKTVISHEKGSDPAAVLYDAVEYAEANDVDVVLGDTAGRLHTSDGLMDQLGKIDRVVEPDLTVFADEAVAGQDAVNRAREFDEAAGTDGSVLTKADADPQGGAAISIAYVTGRPILFLGTGQDYDDLERFDPEAVVDRLVG